MIITVSLLWSCQTESIVADEVVVTKRKPLLDGVPSEADDIYNFKNLQYYHNDKLLKDTTEIKNLMDSARALNIDGNKREIFYTEQEATAFKNKSDVVTSGFGSRTAALDGDDYLHYFYEVYANPLTGDYYYLRYFSVKGPENYSVEKDAIRIHVYKDKKSSDFNDPELVDNFLTGSQTAAERKMNYYLKGNSGNSIAYTVNIVNTTRYDRKVTFESGSGKFVYITVNAGKQAAINGSATGSDPRTYKFNGVSDFAILKHSSNKI